LEFLDGLKCFGSEEIGLVARRAWAASCNGEVVGVEELLERKNVGAVISAAMVGGERDAA
jgi:hypothetical protein